jgi:uncharacterized RDD family membrane protein YckC
MEIENVPVAESSVITNYPPLIKRFQSLIIDQLFIIVCMAVLSNLLPAGDGHNTDILKGGLLFGLFFVYEPFCMAFACTIGNLITGIRVRKLGNHSERINILQSYIRFVFKLFLGIISFFTVTGNENRQAIHDMAAGSVMIYAE